VSEPIKTDFVPKWARGKTSEEIAAIADDEHCQIGPQRGPASIARIEAQCRAIKRELASAETITLEPITMTLQDLLKHEDALKSHFGTTESIAYSNVSMTQLSIARYSGGAKINGKHFIYNPKDDSLIRADVLKYVAKLKKEAKQASRNKDEAMMFGAEDANQDS